MSAEATTQTEGMGAARRGSVASNDRSESGRRDRGGRSRGRGKGKGNSRRSGNEPTAITRSDRPTAERREDTHRVETGALPTTHATMTGDASEVDDDAEVCFICAEPIQYSAIASCNHRTCHICSLRLRALYRNHACAYCKTESKEVVFTLPSEKLFADYQADAGLTRDDKLGIAFENETVMEDTMVLLRFNCPVNTCDVAENGWPNLKLHIKQTHSLVLCDLCVKNKKIFTHEHDLFTGAGLTSHYKHGDRDAQHDPNGFKGHPECGFCRRAFYDDDELFRHCRDKHERCHVCDQMANGPRQAQYFKNWEALSQHFRQDHYPCPAPECVEQKFVVFGSELDLKAHQIEVHPQGLTNAQLKDARKVTTSFSGYDGPVHARGGRGGGRRPEIQFSQPSGGSSLSREQVALRRQMEYQQSRAQATGFGAALSEPDPQPSSSAKSSGRGPKSAAQPTEAFPALGGSSQASSSRQNGSSTEPSARSTPVSQQELDRHQALLDRVQMAVKYNENKIAHYKTNVAQYRSTNIAAIDLIDNLWSLLNIQTDALGGIITSTADLLDSEERKRGLLQAWQDWKIRNRVDKPVAAASTWASTSASNSAGSSSGTSAQRVLNIKNRASRQAAHTSSVWNTRSGQDPIQSAALRLANLNLRPSASVPSVAKTAGGQYKPAWLGNTAASSGAATPIISRGTTPVPSGQATQPRGGADFPSLPAGKQRISTAHLFANRSAGGWSSIGPGGVSSPIDDPALDAPTAQSGAGKKKQKQKQFLFAHGLQRG